MTTPRISVLMSVRNGLPFVETTIESVRAQTCPDWEFVIVDNASSDGTADVVERIALDEPRIRFLQNDSDLGHSGGLNRGIAVCGGEWVARIDGDDIALPDRFERQLAFVSENTDVLATSCLAHYIDAAGKRVGKTVHDLTTREDFARYQVQELPIGLLHPGAFIQKATLDALGGYRPEFDPANDIDLWCRISDRGLILVQPEYLIEYRIHGGSLSAQSFELARLKHLWARDSMIARRRGVPAPSWPEFLAARNNAPWWLRLNRWRKMQAKRLYRQAAQNRLSARRSRALFEMSVAAALQPDYTLPRLKGQLSK
jgi:glycosyltransferase involved in cell wall biosynthesis